MDGASFAGMATGFSIVTIYLGYFFIYRRSKKVEDEENLQKRISEVSLGAKTETKVNLQLIKEQAVQDTFLQSKLPKIEGLSQWLQHAGLQISPTLFIILVSSIGCLISLSLFLIFNVSIILSLLLGIFVCFVGSWAIISILTVKQKNKFLEEFPIALDIMRRALRAGFSTDRALEMIYEQQSGKIGKIFYKISEKMRLGEPLENVLAEMANKLGVDEFRMLAIVLILQRETGGSLAEATENFSKIVRARQSIRKKVKALSAEVRATAIILTALPFFVLGAVFLSSPHYLDSLFYTEKGHYLLMIGAAMLFLGIGIIIRMAYKDFY